jgi:iron complex outermembrane recepter protein
MTRRIIAATRLPLLGGALALTLGLVPSAALAQAISPSAPDDEVVRLSPFEVSSATDRGYIATRASGATKTNTPMIELAHAVSVFNKEFITDTAAQSVFDLVRYTANMTGGDPAGDSRLQLRGFPVNRLRNGIQFPDSGAFTFDELAGVERVEVIKGASAVLFGTSSPGGLLNIVDKRPLPRRSTQLMLQAGSYDFYRATLDSTGPLFQGDGLAVNYRAIASYEDSESWRLHTFRKRTYVNGSLDFRLGRNTSIIQRIDYQDDDLNENYAKPWIWFPPGSTTEAQGVLLNLPDKFNRGERPPLSYKTVQRFNWESVIEHRFNDIWSGRATAVYTDVFGKRNEVFISAQTANINVWPRFWQLIPDDQQQWVFEATTIGEFELGPTKHTLLAGFNYFTNERESANIRFNTTGPVFNVNAPVYGAGIGSEVVNVRRVTRNTADSTGYFIQDQIRLFDERLHLIGGVRRDKLDQEVLNRVTNAPPVSQTDKKTSPRVGALWRVTPQVSVYASMNESFTPSPGTVSVQGVPFPTPTGEQTEVGVKFDVMDGRLVGTASYFELKRQNLTTVDVLNPGFSVATGEVASDGFEFDIGFSITPNWQLIAAAGFQDSGVTKDADPKRIGIPFQNIPERTLAFWTKYDFRDGPLNGLSLGFGGNHEAKRISFEGGITGIRFQVPDYTVYNALAAYSWGDRHKVALNVSNVFDKSHVLGMSGARFAQMGDRRLFRVSYTLTFD